MISPDSESNVNLQRLPGCPRVYTILNRTEPVRRFVFVRYRVRPDSLIASEVKAEMRNRDLNACELLRRFAFERVPRSVVALLTDSNRSASTKKLGKHVIVCEDAVRRHAVGTSLRAGRFWEHNLVRLFFDGSGVDAILPALRTAMFSLSARESSLGGNLVAAQRAGMR